MNNDSGVPNPNGTGNLPTINPNAPATVNPGGVKPEDLMSEIQNRLLGSSGAISSSSSKIEDMITGAISKTQEANDASKKATGSAFDREIGFATDKAAIAEAGYLEGQRGFAQNTAALKDLRTSNEKSIRDLVQRKEEVMLQGDVATASKISDLILKKYEFEQDANQKVFSNLISMSNFALQQSQEKRLQETQNFTEEQAISNVALKYGIEVKPGETFADVIKKAAPFASAEQKLEIKKMEADLAFTQANTKRALNEASAALEKAGKDKSDLGANDFNVLIDSAVAANPKISAIELKALIQGKQLTAAQRTQGYTAVDTYFANKKSTSSTENKFQGTFSSPLANNLAQFGQSKLNPVNISKSILDYIWGTK